MQKHILTCSDFHRKLGSTLFFIFFTVSFGETVSSSSPQETSNCFVSPTAGSRQTSKSLIAGNSCHCSAQILPLLLSGGQQSTDGSFILIFHQALYHMRLLHYGGVQYTVNTTRMKTEGHGREHQVLRSEDSLAGISTIMF